MGFSSLLPFNNSVVHLHRKQFLLTISFLLILFIFFIIGRIEISNIRVNSIKESSSQLSSKYSLDYEKELNKLVQVVNTSDIINYLNTQNFDPLSQILSSKIIVDKLFDLIIICDYKGKVLASSRVTKSGELIPYINLLSANLENETWLKEFISSTNNLSVIHLPKDDPIKQIAFSSKNVKVSISKLEINKCCLIGYTDEGPFNQTISSNFQNRNRILLLSSDNKDVRIFKGQSNIEIESIESAEKKLKKSGYLNVELAIPEINLPPYKVKYQNKIKIFYKKGNYPFIFSWFSLIFIIFLISGSSLLFYFISNRTLSRLRINIDRYLKNGKINHKLSNQYGNRLLVEPESLDKLKLLSIDLQEGLRNISNDTTFINAGTSLIKVISQLNSVSVKTWAEIILDLQKQNFTKEGINVLDTQTLNCEYDFDGTKLETLEKIFNLLSSTFTNGLNQGFFSFINSNNSIELSLDFSENHNNLKIYYTINNIKFIKEKLDNSKISLFINEDDPKYIFNKILLEEDKNLSIFKDLVIHIHEMHGVLFIKNGIDGVIFQISLPILFTHQLYVDIDEKKDFTLIKCTKAWTSRYDTDHFNNRLKMIATTYEIKNILLDINDMEEISEIALVRLFLLQGEVEKRGGKLVIYKSFSKMESQHFYNLLGVKNRLNIFGDLKMAKAAFSEKAEENVTDLKVEKGDAYTKIILSGKMSTIEAAKSFIKALKEAVQKESNIVVDMSTSTFLNSSVLGVLASESLRFTKSGGKIVMFNPNDYVTESLEVFALDKIIPIIRDESDLEKFFTK